MGDGVTPRRGTSGSCPGFAWLAAALALWAAPAAADVYVDRGSPAASDENPGTEARPLATISRAAARARPGETVWVRSGTYRESIALPRSGEGPNARITIAAAPGARVSIKGSDLVSGWIERGGGVWKRAGWRVNSQQVFVDGKPLQQIGVTSPFNTRSWGGRPILPPTGRGLSDMPRGSFFHDAGSATLYVRLPDDGDPNAHELEASVRDVVIGSGPVSFIELRGLAFSHSNASALPAMRGIVNVEGSSWTVTGCSFTYGDFAGLSILGTGHVIRGNVANHNGDVGITINGSDAAHGWAAYEGLPAQRIVLEDNETSDNNYRGFYRYFQAGGLKACACNGVRISRHVARANAGPALWFDLSCRDVVVEDSTLDANTRGVEYELSDRGVIARNVVTRSSEQGIYVSASSDVSVVNNTLDGNRWGIVVHGEPRAEHPELRGNAVWNNIIARSADADLVLYRGPGSGGNTSDHNLFGRAGRDVRISWTDGRDYGVTHRDLRRFADESGLDRHSLVGDPRWADPAAGDYGLRADSPAVRAGRPGAPGRGEPPDLGALGAEAARRGSVPATEATRGSR